MDLYFEPPAGTQRPRPERRRAASVAVKDSVRLPGETMRPRAARRRRRSGLAGRRPASTPPPGRVGISLFLLLAALTGAPRAQPGPPPSFEQEVKASFVYTVAKFVDWPPEAFGDPGAPLVFGILGDDPIEESLQRTVAGKSVSGHPVEVIRVKDGEDPISCHILFVGRSESARVDEVITRVGNSSVLTVGEFDHFAQRGGVLRLRLDQNMVRFEVNVDAAERAHLRISSKILKLGTIVHERKRGSGSP